jgi:signal transduction histidine kinase
MNVQVRKEELGIVLADFQLIYILFRNLIVNAIKFRTDDRQPVITIRSTIAEKGNLPQEMSYGSKAITVEDNGMGFDPTETEKLFELFYKNHRDKKLKGSGVGLAVARKIMSMHKGYLQAEALEEGARFTCYFPK